MLTNATDDERGAARVVTYRAPETFTIERLPLPDLGAGDMLVEVLLCGVDGSELHMYRGEISWINERTPVIFGDEIVGRVAALGTTAGAVRGLTVGDRVVIESRWPCAGCRTCDRGNYYLCENRSPYDGYGTMCSASPPHLWGGYATHVFVPAHALVYPVPDAMKNETALIASSALANGVRWTTAGHVGAGHHVAVIGPGTQGLSCAVAAANAGASVTMVGLDTDTARLDVAADFAGAQTVRIGPQDRIIDTISSIERAGGPVDVAIETAGSPLAKELALSVVRPLGAVVNVSMTSPPEQLVDWASLTYREITLYNPVSHPHAVKDGFALAQSLLAQGKDIGSWITHRFGLDDASEALATASYLRRDRPMKVVLDPRA